MVHGADQPSHVIRFAGFYLYLFQICFLCSRAVRREGFTFHGSTHVSKSKCFCSLVIDVFALKTSLRCSSVIENHSLDKVKKL